MAAGEVIEQVQPSRPLGIELVRPKVCKLLQNPTLAHIVASKLRREWSPEQIAGWLKRTYPDEATYQV